MIEGGLVKDVVILLAVAGIVVPLFGRIGFGSVAGFLVAGAIVGPGGLGGLVGSYPWLAMVTFSDPERVSPFAELGVLFLLFVIGLGLPLRRLWDLRRMVFGLGSAQVLLSAVAITAAMVAWGGSFRAAVTIGLGLALSSTAVVTQTLVDARKLSTTVGRTALAVLLFQDAMVVPIVIVIGLLGRGVVALPGAIAGAVGLAAAALVAIGLAGRFLVGPLMRLAAWTTNREAVVAIGLLLAVGTALVTDAVGLSPALGAFLAGLLLGETEFRHQIEVDIEPFKGLLLGLFFMTVGMSFDPVLLTTGLPAIAGAVIGLLVVKAVVMFALARLFGLPRPAAAETGLLLAGTGEFAFVVLALAGEAGLIDAPAHQFFVAVAAVGLLLTPALALIGERLGKAVGGRETGEGGSGGGDYADHVVIGGFGRVGRVVADVLDAERIPYVAVDLDAEAVAAERAAGRAVFYGDATRREILDRIGGARARAFVVTTGVAAAENAMVRAIRRAWPQAVVHARAKDLAHAGELMKIGAVNAVPEALEASLQLAARVLAAEGLPDEAIAARLAQMRRSESAPFRRSGSGAGGAG